MAIRIHLSPDLLQRRSVESLDVEAHSLEDCLAAVEARFPGARHRLLDDTGRLRPLVRLYVNGTETVSLRGMLVGDEEVVFETADIAARTRVHALARIRRRARLDEEYEKKYGAVSAESGWAGEIGEGLLFVLVGGALLTWGLGNLIVFGNVSIPIVLASVLGAVLLLWGLRNLFIDLVE